MNYSNCFLGLELGSTRIKAVVIDENLKPIGSGSFEWENRLKNGIWTYSMDSVFNGIQSCYNDLARDLGEYPETFAAIGISGMMHGYLPFDDNWKLLAQFRTWRNSITSEAAEKLTAEFDFNIPQRWSIAHLYQAVLNGEEHVGRVAHITTLAGYIHYLLTGVNAVGIGEASGMFPIDSSLKGYRTDLLAKFDSVSGLKAHAEDILPKVLVSGDHAGVLTAEGAEMLDPTGHLQSGIPFAPCEGDAGTGMVATNSVRVGTGNVSAGTSVFAMIVTDHELGVHKEIDMVTTPSGNPVAMVHCSNCTSDINAWVELFFQVLRFNSRTVDKDELFTFLFNKAMEASADCGGLMSYNYYSGESITSVDVGRPVFVRSPNSDFSLSNFMRMHIQSAFATLKIGMDILTEQENVEIRKLYAHGGIFKTPGVAQRILSAAMSAPVSIMESAGEGGPYGIALLAAYMRLKQEGETLEDFLDSRVFAGLNISTELASPQEIEDYRAFVLRYKKAFPIEEAACELIA